jgi:NADH-quinone oxidoreductase subunit L
MVPTPSHDWTLLAALLAVLPPFLSFVTIVLFARPYPRLSAGLSITAVSLSVMSALMLLLIQIQGTKGPETYMGTWLVSSDIRIPLGFLLDPASLLMLSIVAVISLLVQVYSLGYMAGDPGFSRYYAFQSLFAGAMLSLSISPSMIQLYVFWELVGLSSYLLIGFWYEKFSATEAGKKAFVMTRLGDICLFLGILLVLMNLGDLNIQDLNNPAVAQRLSPGLMTLCALLIFGGIVGKSAQFPLLTWLPDAMEGPTPVSALLHSATMVAAGAFLFARLFPFMSQSPTAMTVFLTIGTITMVIASTMAVVDRDIKKVWAYSTISQLGYMIMGLGAGGYFAGFFHLSTHATFKSLLFLCSGVWIHYYETNDLFEIASRQGRRFKIPMICLVLAAASLSGVPPLSGFFSKETILDALADGHNPAWLVLGLVGAFFTPYYAFRAVFIILFPKGTEEAHSAHRTSPILSRGEKGRPKGSYWIMAVPLLVLAAMVLVLGFFQSMLADFLEGRPVAPGRGWIFYASMAFVACGLGLAWFEFGRKGASRVGFFERVTPLRVLFANRWYLDHFYRLLLRVVVYKIFASLAIRNDRQLIDNGLDAFCGTTVESGRRLSRLQSGLVRDNFLLAFLALALLGLWFYFI